jgi:hypothetical protein
MIAWLKRIAREWSAENSIPAVSWSQFESDPKLGEELRKTLANPAFHMAIRVLEDACPRGIPAAGSQATDYAYLHGFALGYVRAIDNLRVLAAKRPTELPPPDFQTPPDEPVPDELFSVN